MSAVCLFIILVLGLSRADAAGCSGLKIMVPLYEYPGSAWDTVVAYAHNVTTLAIINPDNGPGDGADEDFTKYMQQMSTAGVTMVGYVHTSWGSRSMTDVKNEINTYSSKFQHVSGIFLDEASDSAKQLSYYQTLYTYITNIPNFKYVILNPGTMPDEQYMDVATQIVTYEDTYSKFASSANLSIGSCSDKNKFVSMMYSTSSSSMESAVDEANDKQYGWIYVTDAKLGGNTYNKLPSYYPSLTEYIATGAANVTTTSGAVSIYGSLTLYPLLVLLGLLCALQLL